MTIEIKLAADCGTAAELRGEILSEVHGVSSIELEIRHGSTRFRDPSLANTFVLVATVGAASTARASFISGAFMLLERKRNPAAKIILQGADGTRVEAPFPITQERLLELSELARTLPKPSIQLTTR